MVSKSEGLDGMSVDQISELLEGALEGKSYGYGIDALNDELAKRAKVVRGVVQPTAVSRPSAGGHRVWSPTDGSDRYGDVGMRMAKTKL